MLVFRLLSSTLRRMSLAYADEAIHLREVAALSTAEIVRYWVRVCEDNRTHLQSGDLSLIYAGEVVELPAR